jgi:predicted small lipoprotein YifL
MGRRAVMSVMACALAVSTFAACGRSPKTVPPSAKQVQASQGSEDTRAATEVSTVTVNSEDTPDAGANTAAAAVTATAVEAEDSEAASAAAATAANSTDHDNEQDYLSDSSHETRIALNGNSITVDGDGVTADGSKVTITSAGTYRISGSLSDGQIVVDTDDAETVRLVLDGVNIHSYTGAPLYVMAAEATMIVLAEDSANTISDAEAYVFENAEEDEPNAAIFSKDDLTIYGDGSLTVEGNYNDGIASKDGLIIAGGTITVRSVDDGIRGKDYLVVKGGYITVDAQGDGLKSDNDQDATEGYISVETGVIDITCGGDAIQAQTDVVIRDGKFTLSSGGGSNSHINEDTSAKGIKAGVNVTIDGGTFTIDCADDAIHSNEHMVINGGTFVLASGDDAMHADATLTINGGDILITDSYEGIESAVITINGGNIDITSWDDGVNVSAGKDGSGTMLQPGPGGGPGRGGRGGPGQDAFAYSANDYLYVRGGNVVVNAAGDGIDVNGSIEMSDGVVIVNGPTEQMNGALDCIGTFNISGGFLVAVGSAGMAETADASSTQHSLLLNLNGTLQAGTLFRIQSADGNDVLTFAPAKRYQSIAFSSPELANGATYDVYYGGSSTGTLEDGLYQGGAYTGGTLMGSFTISGMVTTLGTGRRY